MNSDNINNCINKLKRNLSENVINEIASDVRFYQRRSKVTPTRFLWTIIAGMASNHINSLADLSRLFHTVADGETVTPKAFHTRLNQSGFPKLMKQVFELLMPCLVDQVLGSKIKKLNRFKDILIQDGTYLSVNDKLKKTYKGRWSNKPASLGIHCLFSLTKMQPTDIKLAPAHQSELNFLPDLTTQQGVLLLFDKAYISAENFTVLNENGAYYICRAKDKNSNPTILTVIKGPKKAKKAVGSKLRSLNSSIKGELPRKTMDFIIEGNPSRKIKCVNRLVLYWVKKKKKHVMLYTNLSATEFSADEIASIYRVRWQIELFFKDCKSHTCLKKFNTTKPHIVEGLVWASLIAVVLRRYLSHTAHEKDKSRSSHFIAGSMSWLYMTNIAICAVDKYRGIYEVMETVLEKLKLLAGRTKNKRSSALNDIKFAPL